MESSQYTHLPPNPCDKANFLSKLFFVWTLPFFKKGYEKMLNVDDMYQPLTCDKSELLGDRLEANWIRKTSKSKQTSLLSVIFTTFWKDYALLSLCVFCTDIIFRLGQPYFLGRLLEYFREDTKVSYHEAFIYAIGILVMNGLIALFGNHMQHLAFHNGMKVRVAICSLIYRKALRLSHTALGETSPGKLVNLLSNDVNRFDWATFFVNSLWVSPLLTFIVGCLMWEEVGPAGLVGILVVFTIVPLMSYAGKLTSKFRMKTAIRTDERVRFMDEIVSGVQIIKMYAWEIPFTKLINYTRKLEMKMVRKTSYIRGIHMTSMLFTTRCAMFCTMLTIALLYGSDKINAASMFVISSYLGVTSHLMSQRFSRSIAEVAELKVALSRLQKLLYMEEREFGTDDDKNTKNGSTNHMIKNSNSTETETLDVSISMKNVRARWVMPNNDDTVTAKSIQNGNSKHNGGIIQDVMHLEKQLKPTLNNFSIEFPKGKLIGVIGTVGAGKSSLLQAILRELPVESGSISIHGSISYASQEPWIFAASARQNILFGKKYDRDRYNAVVRTCALAKDFEQFENGDLTIVGERGASLSGGQKARINLARACYRSADIYLLDDPLSAVDSHVGSHIFDKCIGPKSRLAKLKATRILVTHQIHFLKEADWLVVVKDGEIEVQGSPADLYRSGVDFVELVGMIETPQIRGNVEFNRQSSETPSMRSSSSNSSLSSSGSLNAPKSDDIEKKDLGIGLEASSKGKVKGSLTVNYFRAGASWPTLFIVLFSFVFVQCLASSVDYWVSVWTSQEQARTRARETGSQNDESSILSTETCIYVQASLVAGLLVFGILRSISFYEICVRISRNIHNSMFKGIISSSMRFFDINPSGRILNRFSKDIGAVDEILPKSILDSTQNILSMIGSIILAAVVNPYFLIPVAVLSIFFILARKVYLKTSRSVRRLEGMAKSPAFTHLAATLSGLPTIRAYKAEEILKKEFDNHQDTHTACWFVAISTTAMFGFCLDFICLIFISCIVLYYMLLDTGTSGEKIGLAVSQAISLTGMVGWGVRQSTEVNNQMMSVERVLEYRDLEPEKQPLKPSNVTKDWPTKGLIEFRNVFYRYFAEAEPVLRDLSFVIKPREKIGIVGRTGAGKSSLIGAIFRLACVEGKILIDDIDTASIRLSDLRKRIAIIPQDPVLFSGTLRRNLDPFEEYSDTDIWSALESVELKQTVSDAFGLQSIVLPHGANYSVGQRQLLCLARAILRKNRILVLDEATANVDPQTDLLIQQTIREKFTDCTVLTVAHRLNTIIDSDRILVMDSGRAAEFDQPHCLLQMEDGIFHGMVKALGEQEYDRLSQSAHEQFNSNYENSRKVTSL